MGFPLGSEPHTLAQFARRAGISEGRARALFTAKPSGLPRPDRQDADSRPLWWASTIDAWCSRTGREVSQDSVWLFRAAPAAAPVAELRRGVVELRTWRKQPFYVIVWDTPDGHLVYLQPLDDTGGDYKDSMAVAAAESIEPRWWSSTVVVMPLEEPFRPDEDSSFGPMAYVYRLEVVDQAEPNRTVRGGRRRWFAASQVSGPVKAEPRAVWEGQLDLCDVAKVVGRPVPAWLDDTPLTANADRSLSYTFTTADTTTEWPQTQEQLQRALEAGMPQRFPAGFAALAVEAADTLASVQRSHETTADSGPGWYLVCRPARPSPSIELEQTITTAAPVADLGSVRAELMELRRVEAELDYEDPIGETYAHVIELLRLQLRRAAIADGSVGSYQDYVPVVDDGWLTYSAPWQGPVVQAWQRNLTPVEQVEFRSLLRLRRVRRLLGYYSEDQIQQAYRDSQDRYVLVVKLDNGSIFSLAEWPASLDVVAGWTDETVLAADDSAGVVTLMALTPDGPGRPMRTDPVPLLPNDDREAFGYGYTGGTPTTTYRALLRVALGDQHHAAASLPGQAEQRIAMRKSSQLWEAISTTSGPLRLSWPQVKLWARADRRATRSVGHEE